MEVWGWKTILGSVNTTYQLANGPVFIKTIIVWNITGAASAILYNEKTAVTTNMFLTVWSGISETKVIMFDDPCQLDTGCYITLASTSGILVQYKPI